MKPVKSEYLYCDYTITKYQLKNGQHHREDGPAWYIDYKSGKRCEEWRIHDKLHRYGGPARHYVGLASYFIHDRNVTDTVIAWLRERDYKWETMTDVEKWELELFMRSL